MLQVVRRVVYSVREGEVELRVTARLAGTLSSPTKGTVPEYPQELSRATGSTKSPVITRQVLSDEAGLWSSWVVMSTDQDQEDTRLDAGILTK